MAVRLLSTDPSEPGVFAVGQFAYGIFAFGQIATGVVAVGQVARGVIAIGQVAVGLIAVGQGAFGLFFGIGMLGVFGRGFPLPLVPKLPRPRVLPPTTEIGQIRMGYGDGWVAADLIPSRSGVPTLSVGDIRLRARLVPLAKAELERYAVPKVVAHVRKVGEVLICDRLVHVPVPITQKRNFMPLTTLRMVMLVILAIAVWVAIWPPIAGLF